MEQIILAGGDFRELEPRLQALDGVKATTRGYTGGTIENPTAEDVAAGDSGHLEAVLVEYDAARLATADLLRDFLKLTGEATAPQFHSGIFYVTDDEKTIAE